jgi:hypothetical protein
MKAALLGRPKCLIEKPSGRVSNERFEEEVTAYVTEFKNRQTAAFEREGKRKVTPAKSGTSDGLPQNFQPTSGQLPVKVGEVSRELPPNQNTEVSKKLNEINGHRTTILPEPSQSGGTAVDPHTRVLDLELEKKRREESQQQVRVSDSAARDVATKAPPNWRELEKRLEEAAGAALASKASYPGLMNLSDPISWISAGADLELDVIPAVAFVSAKTMASRNFRPIKSWAYFRNAVADFKGNRERGLPTPVPVGQEDPTASNTESKADRLRREAKERMAARANGASL